MPQIPKWIDTPLPLVPEISQLPHWLARIEKHETIKKELHSKIIFHKDKHEATEYAILYLHGFGSSINETQPLTDMLSKKIACNVVFQRIARHGISLSPMEYLPSQLWYHSALQGLSIAQELGKKVIVISCSTGGTLSLLLSARKRATKEMSAQILISPNCWPHPKFSCGLFLTPLHSFMETIPSIPILGPLLTPKNTSPEEEEMPHVYSPHLIHSARSEAHEFNNTLRIPTRAITQMMRLVRLLWIIRRKSPDRFRIPSITVASPHDKEVIFGMTKKFFHTLPEEKHQMIEFDQSDNGKNHVLAGGLFSPSTTEEIYALLITALSTQLKITLPSFKKKKTAHTKQTTQRSKK